MSNVSKDNEEETEKVKVVFSALKPWLNMDLYQAEKKAVEAPPPSSTYLDALRAKGASEEELKEASDRRNQALQGQEESVEGITLGDEFDPSVVISTQG